MSKISSMTVSEVGAAIIAAYSEGNDGSRRYSVVHEGNNEYTLYTATPAGTWSTAIHADEVEDIIKAS